MIPIPRRVLGVPEPLGATWWRDVLPMLLEQLLGFIRCLTPPGRRIIQMCDVCRSLSTPRLPSTYPDRRRGEGQVNRAGEPWVGLDAPGESAISARFRKALIARGHVVPGRSLS